MFLYQSKNKSSQTLLDYIFVPECLNHKIVFKEINADFKYEIEIIFRFLLKLILKKYLGNLPLTYQELFLNGGSRIQLI